MIKLEQDVNDFFFCTSADWSTVVKAKNENEAANRAVSKVMNELEEEALISPCLRVKKIEEKFEDSDILIRIDKVLADMGMHKESRSMSQILKNLKK